MTRFTIPLIWTLCLVLAACSPVTPREEPAKTNEVPEFNRLVLEIAHSYPTDGTHDYWWPRAGESSYDGASKDFYLDGVKVLEGEPEGRTFCCGWTLEVFLQAYKQYLEENPGAEQKLAAADWQRFQRLWFVTDVNGPGPSAALEEFGLGRTIPQSEALPGDFVQIWRRWDKETKSNGTGHSVIFLGWVHNDAGEITGLRYISTQPGTDGISENTEYFAPPADSKGVAEEFTHWGRVELQ